MAPEIFRIQLFDDFENEYAGEIGFDPFKVDIWALGVMLFEVNKLPKAFYGFFFKRLIKACHLCHFEMIFLELPFDRFRGSAQIYKAQMGRNWDFPLHANLTPDCRAIIKAMLEPEPQLRIDPYGICMHCWIQNSYMKNNGWHMKK